ncbi:MAG: molybdopterin molybdotransferase MoeA [Methermicoccaceae archaeon]
MNPIPIKQARQILTRERSALYKRLGYELVKWEEAWGRVLAEDVVASIKSPPEDVSTMDGFAVMGGTEYPLHLREHGEALAGNRPPPLSRGETCRIATGGFLPEGADAVLVQEEAILEGDILTGSHVESGQFVIKKGSDISEGDVLARAGEVINARIAALLPLSSKEHPGKVKVLKTPRVGILGTGDELTKEVIPDTNTYMVYTYLRELGIPATRVGVVRDDYEELKSVVEQCAQDYDVLITIGGASVGKHDVVRQLLEKEGKNVFQGIGLKPGKPMSFGYVMQKPILCLPGKPGGAFTSLELVGSYLFCTPTRCTIEATMPEEVKGKGEFYQVVYANLKDGKLIPFGIENGEYNTSVASASLSILERECYVYFKGTVSAGQKVQVNLLNHPLLRSYDWVSEDMMSG